MNEERFWTIIEHTQVAERDERVPFPEVKRNEQRLELLREQLAALSLEERKTFHSLFRQLMEQIGGRYEGHHHLGDLLEEDGLSFTHVFRSG